jgi:histidinol-phosphatase
MRLAHHMVTIADGIALSHFGELVHVTTKADGSPVSEADLAVDRALVQVLTSERPADGVISEEGGDIRCGAHRRWIVDPIDGTQSYLAERGDWGCHVALEVDGELALAVLSRPCKRRRWWAVRGAGAFAAPSGDPTRRQRLFVSGTRSLADARVGGLVAPHAPEIEAIAAHASWAADEPSPIPAFLEGRLDAVIDDGGQPWDLAPAALLTIEAGGSFSDGSGGQRIDLSWGLFSNGHLHGALSKALAT